MSKSIANFTILPIPFSRFLFINKEFDKLNLEGLPEGSRGIHCEFCIKKHHHRSRLWQIFFVGIILIGCFMYWMAGKLLIYVPLSIIANVQKMLILASVVGLLGLALEILDYRENLKKNRPPFPVIGSSPKVDVSERVVGQIKLDEAGNYQEKVYVKKGGIKLKIILTPSDFERMRVYVSKYHLAHPNKFLLNAGFILFDCETKVQFVDHRFLLLGNTVNTLAFEQEVNIPSFPILDRDDLWERRFEEIYKSQLNKCELPVQVVPEIVNEGDRLALELTLQVKCNSKANLELQRKPFLYQLSLNYPWQLGKVESVNPTADIQFLSDDNNLNSKSCIVTWKSVDFAYHVGGLNYEFFVFYVRFQNDIQSGMVFSGDIHVRIFESVIGLNNFRYFYPHGVLRFSSEELFPNIYTDLFVRFSLDTHSMVIRRAVKKERKVKVQIKPSHFMINDLVTGLGSIGAYVQRVIENPPRTNKAHASIVNRFWDVAGRYYVNSGIYPIDFHIVVIGKEQYLDSDLPDSGETAFEITVQATIHSMEMEKEVNLLFEKLVWLISDLNDSSND
ncbi:MAG: hypothetical protein KDD45_04105 [Bdellovibrionales bacterium]|nr:hypothetical protein [Bdellovibrionales bacterium]